MLDINQAINATQGNTAEIPGNLDELESWSAFRAEELARAEGIALTEDHWAVIRYLRNDYQENGLAEGGNMLLKRMGEAFAGMGGKKRLYRLFPGGPVSQGCRIAGLPVPPYSHDPSFGSVE